MQTLRSFPQGKINVIKIHSLFFRSLQLITVLSLIRRVTKVCLSKIETPFLFNEKQKVVKS